MKNKDNLQPLYEEEVQCDNIEEMDDCAFLSACYTPIPVYEETCEFVTSKVAEIEEEVDKLSSELNEAYYIAIAQEIKQRTNYVRSKEFLLMFLRAENFDATKAAIRMAYFFKWKLHLFGLETLPRPITYDDLNEDDKKVLDCECFHYSGVDCEGRPILTLQLQPFIEAGFYREKYMDSANRIGFYVRMCIIEGNDECQKNGMVVIQWGLGSTQFSLKDFRLLISAGRLFREAIPTKLVAVHDCRADNLTTSWMAFIISFMPKQIRDKTILHIKNSPADCFSTLSQYGIDVDALPSNITGNVIEGGIVQEKLDQLQQKQMLAMPNNNFVETEEVLHGETMDCNANPISFRDYEKKLTEFDVLSMDLMEALERNSTTSNNAICWSRGGTTITIHKSDFSDFVLPNQFEGIKFDSFIRKLLRCGFKRLINEGRTNMNYIEFEHVEFQKNSEQLLRNWKNRDLLVGWKHSRKFPVKLMNALENSVMPNAIWWVCDGNAIAIEKSMFPIVLDEYFPGLKMESFYRMMGKWGFRRLSDKEEPSGNVIVFKNDLFKKDMPHLVLSNLRRAVPKPNFFEKLYNILASDEMAKDAIWWLDDGNSFAIDRDNFSRDILPREYNGIKFRSFRRSLTRWDFQQLSKNDKILIFQHPKFQRSILQQSKRYL